MSKSKKPKKVKIKSIKYGGYRPDPLGPKDVPEMKELEEMLEGCANPSTWSPPSNKETPGLGKWIESNPKGELPHKQLDKDLAYLQVCVAAMGERLDALEAENVRLRSLWGGTTHTGVPFWAGYPQTETWGGPKVWSSVTTGENMITG